MNTRESYDAAASAYAEHLFRELEQKPLDRHLLNRFAEAVHGGPVLELGCGPGQVARYLHGLGVSVSGIDLSVEMIRVARALTPEVEFRVGDMRSLDVADESLAGVVAFYSIVHFNEGELDVVFRELRRVLRPNGWALIAFHIGDEVIHVDELFGVAVSLDFRFHVPEKVTDALRRANLCVVESVQRAPYEGAEHPSRRCYFLARPERADLILE